MHSIKLQDIKAITLKIAQARQKTVWTNERRAQSIWRLNVRRSLVQTVFRYTCAILSVMALISCNREDDLMMTKAETTLYFCIISTNASASSPPFTRSLE